MAGRRPSAPSTPEAPRVVVPKLIKDPIWSLKPWPAIVTIKGRDMEIPALPAVDWLLVLLVAEPNLDDFIEQFLPEVEEMLDDGDVTLDEAYEVCLDVITTVSARSWWVTLRMLQVARDHWHILCGRMLRYDANTLPFSGWLDLLLLTIIESMDPKDVTMFSMKLEMPPPTVTGLPEEEMEISASSFLNMGRDVP